MLEDEAEYQSAERSQARGRHKKELGEAYDAVIQGRATRETAQGSAASVALKLQVAQSHLTDWEEWYARTFPPKAFPEEDGAGGYVAGEDE